MRIKIRDAGKVIEKQQIIDGLTFEVSLNPPKMYGLIGPNGAGKTTILKLLSGLYIHNKGYIGVNEEEVTYDKWARENVAYIPTSERALFFKNTVYDNIMYYGMTKGTSPKLIKKNIEFYSKQMRMTDILHKRVEQLSTGQKKKVQIISAVSTGRSLLLLDEPSVGLDVESTKEFKELLLDVNQNLNSSIIIASHDINLLSDLIDNFHFILEGEIQNSVSGFHSSKELETLYYNLKKGD